MFFENSYFYYISIGLQVICAIHCIQRGNQNKWIWLIVFLPVVGSIAYIYTEMLSGRNMRGPKLDVGAIINPGGKIKKLEENLRFTDTFANKIKLADAYLAAGYTGQAIELYESSLTGTFADNEHAISQLMLAYFNKQRYEDVITSARKISRSQKFPKSKAHMFYALSLENVGQPEAAETEFKAMKGRYSCFEQRYQYGKFLLRVGRDDDARRIFTDILDELPHLSSMERKSNRAWFNNTKEELRAMEVGTIKR
ncbi:PLDc N-terminal domain-containing protein [Mucilaginibacter paludis]|uniref:Cardiolipin synthase N-terminal domain-containing protein n=1 Tax=Mucilaginibacter paludis DSM 18603 TaxID=714943 RepID=H1YGN6_9SPHI|nr:PLDc N-terminal domain-containing protein [Mucilaginibacter paludis]EHQ25422.1 hypothetical protein Mucpa_1258 [Mucilaginibacter paludis DSM 18603]